MSDTASDSLIEYPCDFPIKVMGEAHEDFAGTVCHVVRAHAPDFDAASIQARASTGGRYVSLTCTVRVQSREQLDNLYRDLSTHPAVAMVL
ncbi:MAG: YbeD family protein [Burkholderiales bacterium]